MFTIWPQILFLVLGLVSLNFLISFVLSKFFILLAKKYGIVDSKVSAPDRKDQKEPVPLIGATGFVVSSLFFGGYLWLIRKGFQLPGFDSKISDILGFGLSQFHIIWIYVSILIILIGGFFDDWFQFKSKVMILPTFLALLVTIFLGNIRIQNLSFPLNLIIPEVYWVQILLTFLWLGVCVASTKFLDGMDGLVSTVGIIGFLTISGISLLSNVNQPLIFTLALIWASGIAGFLPFNLPNAKAYLGEAGAQIIGFLIGVLSIISGAKVATASTIMGWFILDIFLVILVRIFVLRKNPLEGDRLHWHHRLQALGLNKTQTLLFTSMVLILTASGGIFLKTEQKIYVLLFQIIFSIVFFIISLKLTWKKLVTKV